MGIFKGLNLSLLFNTVFVCKVNKKTQGISSVVNQKMVAPSKEKAAEEPGGCWSIILG